MGGFSSRPCITFRVIVLWLGLAPTSILFAQDTSTAQAGTKDWRTKELQTLNGYFPFSSVKNKSQWAKRQNDIRTRILISQGLWPLPSKSPLNAVVHRRIDRADYSIEAVYFESWPGHFVTGSLYRPKNKPGPHPAVLCPHGHWRDARFYDAGEAAAKKSIAAGGERFESAARNHIQARCVQLARMGCVVLLYDMTGNSDSIQLGHRPDEAKHLDTRSNWGFFSAQAELRLQNMMGLQTWNSIRAIDFLQKQPHIDSSRIGVTGASGGGTQSMIVAAIDERITAAMPCVMVSTAMQGGCTCENAPLMRIGQGNIDIAACIAPRPLGLTAADDWTINLETKGYPELRNLYSMLGHKNRLTAAFHTHFKHNYNHVNRTIMYGFYNRHFDLGFDEPVLERDFQRQTASELTVWDENHPAPSGDQVGDQHEIDLLRKQTADSVQKLAKLIPSNQEELAAFKSIVGEAWRIILGRTLDEVGNVVYSGRSKKVLDGVIVESGTLTHEYAGSQANRSLIEIVSVKLLRPIDGDPKGVVIWLGEAGTGVLNRNGVIAKDAKDWIANGFVVLAANLFRHSSDRRQPMWFQRKGEKAWERFSAYTYGYNNSLFVQRVHDALSVIKFAQSFNTPIRLLGDGRRTGAIALAARTQVGNAIAETEINLEGFRFDTLSDQADEMFVPGSVKYFGIDGLLSLCVPGKVVVRNVGSTEITKRVYAAAKQSNHLTIEKTVHHGEAQ